MFFRDQIDKPLNSAQGDANNRELLDRIAIAAAAGAAFRTTGISFSGTDYVQHFQNGDTLRIAVPWPVPSFAGDWQALTFYALLTLLTVPGSGLFFVLLAHTSGPTFDPDATDGEGNPLYRKLLPQDAERYFLGCDAPGIMVANQNLLFHRFTTAVTFPANFGAYLRRRTKAGGSVNATASTVIDVAKATDAVPTTFASVGSITIAAGSVSPTFSTSGVALLFAEGDVLRLRGPAIPDVTFTDFHCTLVGFETP